MESALYSCQDSTSGKEVYWTEESPRLESVQRFSRMESTVLRRILAVVTSLVVVVGLAACSQEDTDKTLTVGYTAELNGLDPSTVDGAGTPFALLYNVYETLVKADDQGEIQPLLAESWDVSPDNKEYTFHLVEGATFASGEPVNADAVVGSIDYIRGGQGADAPVRPLLVQQMSPVASAEAVDETTVKVTLSQPSNQWLYNMTGPAGIIYDPTGMDSLDTDPAGSGPYIFTNWDTGSSLSLERNEDYWGTKPDPTQIQFKLYTEANAMTSAMLSGDLDVISNLTTPDALARFDDESRFTILQGETDGEVVLGYNHTTEALRDIRVRRAITHAIDRQALLDSTWGGKGTLIGSMVPTRDPWYEDLSETYPYDPEQAKQLLSQAGYADGLTLRLRVPILPYATSAARFIAAQLQEVGITAEVEELEFATWLDDVFTKGNYDLTIVAHVEPRDIAVFANPDSYWHYDNPEFQDLVARADAGSPEEQVTLLKQAAKLLADDAAATWLYLLPNLIITTPQVGGIAANSTNLSFDLTHVTING